MDALFRAYVANLKLGVQVIGAIALAAIIASGLGNLILAIPGIDPEVKEYVGPVCIIVCFVGVVWGYDRYRRWRFFRNLGKARPGPASGPWQHDD